MSVDEIEAIANGIHTQQVDDEIDDLGIRLLGVGISNFKVLEMGTNPIQLTLSF